MTNFNYKLRTEQLPLSPQLYQVISNVDNDNGAKITWARAPNTCPNRWHISGKRKNNLSFDTFAFKGRLNVCNINCSIIKAATCHCNGHVLRCVFIDSLSLPVWSGEQLLEWGSFCASSKTANKASCVASLFNVMK